MRMQITLAAAAAALLLAGWLAGGSGNVAEAQSQSDIEAALLEGYEWKMFSNNVAGTGGSGGNANQFDIAVVGRSVIGNTWLYNSKSGKVYRVFERCAESGSYSGTAGCLIAVRVYSNDRLDTYLPNPATDDPPGLER